MIKKINFPLVLGTIIIFTLGIIIFFGESIATVDPYATGYVSPPTKVNFFGTDMLGRDIFSLIMIGAQTTFKIVLLSTFFRFLIALPLSLLAGFGNKTSISIIKVFSAIFSAIPTLIISFMILELPTIIKLPLEESIIAFIVVLTFVGWGSLANILQDRVKDILEQNFIQGEIAIGKSKFKIALENVMPHLIASMIIFTFLEIGKVLLLIAQLGVFGTYVGKSSVTSDFILIQESVRPTTHPEWGSMLASARYALANRRAWMVIFPGLAVSISIIGFNLLAEGLHHELVKRNSMIIAWIKRIPFHLSPITYVYQIRNYNSFKKSVVIKTSIILLIFVVPILPAKGSLYLIDEISVFNHIEELAKDEYEGRLVGTEGRDRTSEYIISQLQLSNIKPLYDDSYIDEFEINYPMKIINSSSLLISNEGKAENLDLYFRKDFNINTWFYTKGSGYTPVDNWNGVLLTEDAFKSRNFDDSRDYFVILDSSILNLDNASMRNIRQIGGHSNVNGVIAPIEYKDIIERKGFIDLADSEDYHRFKRNSSSPPFIIYVTTETANKLREFQGYEISVQNTFAHDEFITTGKNIGGIIKGKSSEPVILVTSYDYFGYDKENRYLGLYENGSSVASILEIAKTLGAIEETPEQTIIFTFLDSSKFRSRGANEFARSYMKGNSQSYIYLSYMGFDNDSNLYIDTSLTSSNEIEIFSHIKYMRARASKNKIQMPNELISRLYYDTTELRRASNSGIMLSGVNISEAQVLYGMKQNDLDMISPKKLKLHTQLLLDTIVNMLY